MPPGHLTRRLALLLPLAVAACGGGGEEADFPPLRYTYLPPIQLNVAAIRIEQHFVAAGVAPDVSTQDPVPPAEALKAMAQDRLQAFGTANRAVFAILDASLTRENDVLIGSMAVSLTILDDGGSQLGFAEARVQSRHTGRITDLRSVLYDLTKSMMNDMNIEFEFQVRKNLKNWLTTTTAPDTPVQQAPLDQGSPDQAAPDQGPPSQTSPEQVPSGQAPTSQTVPGEPSGAPLPGGEAMPDQAPPGQTAPYSPAPAPAQ